FSSRRRHTRSKRDWSSDVCSSDLIVGGGRDLQVPASAAELLYEAQPNTDKLIIEKMNHVLKEAPEDEQGNKETYSNPDLPLADRSEERRVGKECRGRWGQVQKEEE